MHAFDLTRRPVLATLAVFVAIVAVSTVKLGDTPLNGTEPHRAIPAHQMLESGEWLIPQLWGQPYLAKPPLHYWTLAVAEFLVGGGGEWIWRLPSAAAAGLLGAVVCVFSRRWFGPLAGLVAGVSCLGLVALWSQARKADIDALHTLSVVAAALCLVELGAGRRAPAPSGAVGGALDALLLAIMPCRFPRRCRWRCTRTRATPSVSRAGGSCAGWRGPSSSRSSLGCSLAS